MAAQKALSCVYRTGQRFGAGHMIDILMGKETERAVQFGHTKLSVFGVGKDLEKGKWDSVFRQLVAGDYVEVDLEGYGTFKLNPKSWAVLKEGQKVWLRDDPPPAKSKKGPARTNPRQAQEQNLPAYVVFHDTALREMVSQRPTTLKEFAQIPGVGETKLKRYEAAFLEILRQTSKDNPSSPKM